MAPAKKTADRAGPQRSIASFFSKKQSKSPDKSSPGRKKKASLVIGHTDPSKIEVKSAPGKKKEIVEDGYADASVNVARTPPDAGGNPRKRRRLSRKANDSETSPIDSIGKKVQPVPTPSPVDTVGSAKAYRASVLSQASQDNVVKCPESVIGKKVKVYWPLDKAWYAGCVKSYNSTLGQHVVLYDDGEEEHVALGNEKVEWLPETVEIKEETDVKRLPRGRLEPQKRNSGSKRKNLGGVEKPTAKESITGEGGQGLRRARRQVIYEEPDDSDVKEVMDDDDDEDDDDFHADVEESDGEESESSDGQNDTSSQEEEEEEDSDDCRISDIKPKKAVQSSATKGQQRSGKKVDLQTRKSAKNQKISAPAQVLLSGTAMSSGAQKLGRGHSSDSATKVGSKGVVESPLSGEIAERFGGRDAQKFKFLGKYEDRKDADGRRPTDLAYNHRTLHLPAEFLKALSGGQRQWWLFKAKHMDKVLLFKMGKFYEMFEMDAHIGAKELDLQYMKGEQPHCGFPEKNFSDNAEKLARKGYRVLVVEQTETPDQLEKRRRETGSKDKVVMREVCAVITKGTMVDGDIVATSSEAMLSLTERPLHNDASVLGLCVVDASTSSFQLGQFEDDAARTRLCSILTELRPVELIIPRGLLSTATSRALRDYTRQPLVNDLVPVTEFWDHRKSFEELTYVYSHLKSPSEKNMVAKEEDLPHILRCLNESREQGELALSAMGACVFYLRQALLDQTMLSLQKIELLPGCESILGGLSNSGDPGWRQCGIETVFNKVEPYMVLDAAALENLEIIENRNGGTQGTLLARLDHCTTPLGRKLLKGWLARPLLEVESIRQRQVAIGDLKGVAAEAVTLFRKELAGIPDMERLLARLHASSGANGRNASKVVMYEDVGKKQVHQFTAALRGCRTMLQAAAYFESCLSDLNSTRLRDLLTPGKGTPQMMSVIEHFETAFDWSEAEKSGRIVPREGVDEAFDAATATVTAVEGKLTAYLEEQRKHFGNSSEIGYLTVGKESYQMEVPDRFLAKVPPEFEVRSSRKGFRRYWSPQIKDLGQELAAGQEQRESALKGILMRLVHKFCEDHSIWLSAARTIAEVDVLISLSAARLYTDGPTCTPSFVEKGQQAPWFCAKGLRHPTVGGTLASGNCFVPNDITLGGETHAPFMLLTGPNMGGKSTLLRQVCLAVTLAQVGADVPAEQLELAPVDQVFVRMGARDHIMAGQSTFLVELLETAVMLRSATRNSLVALDELGRGTATSDGQAIAHSVLQRLAHEVGCRGMFSTHYHRLATDHCLDPTVSLYHMACKVAATKGGSEEVTFLYKLSPGACPKSYGVNVARLAGMPEPVLQRAGVRSAELEFLFEQSGNSAVMNSATALLKDLGKVLEDLSSRDQVTEAMKMLAPLREQAKQITTIEP